ncbi:MAG: circularly permuted type 2 ATP-grasp protein, partial [Solirubrobacteraceae bacterium]
MESEPRAQPFDEDRDELGEPRYGYGQMLEALQGADLDGLAVSVKRRLADEGVSFGPEPFVVDPIPRLIGGREWAELERGLAQRTRALNHFLTDIYRERRIVDAGIVPEEVLVDAEGYEPDLAGRVPQTPPPAAIIGFDLVREPGGTFLVLEDNLRTPSGYSYLLAARAALKEILPSGVPVPRPIDPVIYELLGATLRAAAPETSREDPTMVLLTDGPDNVAYYE